MQDITDWPEKGPVRVPALAVTASGASTEVVSASVTASVRDTDVTARTGEVVWRPRDAAARAQQSVLSPGVPARGDRVTVDAGEGDALARLLTGKVDTTGVEVPGVLTSEFMDDFDMLSTPVTVPSLVAKMTPYEDEGPFRMIGLTATWVMQFVLGECGFEATPRGRLGGAVTASLNGSLWPESGTLKLSGTAPAWKAAPWGDGAHGFTATYTANARSMSDGALELVCLVGAAGGAVDSSQIRVHFPGTGNSVEVRVYSASRAVEARLVSGGVSTAAATLSTSQMVDAEWVRLRVSPGGAWTLENDRGITSTGTATVPTAHRGVADRIVVTVPTGGVCLGGVNVGHYAAPGSAWARTAVLDRPDGSLFATRQLVRVPAIKVLRERAEAERARMWIDANGVFQWRARGVWGAGAPVATLSDVDLLGYSMSIDYDSVYSGATVSYRDPIIESRALATITLYQGRSQVMNAGDVQRDFIEPPADEDWPWLATVMNVLPEGSGTAFSKGLRTWGGAVRVTNDGAYDYWATGPGNGGWATASLERITAKTWLHTLTVATGLPSDQTVETRTPRDEHIPGGGGFATQWENQGLPMIRGYARVTWVDYQADSTVATQQVLPRLEHDCSWWVQGNAVQRLADWLADRHQAPVVTITGLQIVPDARLEIGDVVDLSDRTYAGLSARVVITGIRYSTSEGAASMALDVEVVSVAVTSRTYADVQASADGATYAQFQALLGAVTYAEQEAQ